LAVKELIIRGFLISGVVGLSLQERKIIKNKKTNPQIKILIFILSYLFALICVLIILIDNKIGKSTSSVKMSYYAIFCLIFSGEF